MNKNTYAMWPALLSLALLFVAQSSVFSQKKRQDKSTYQSSEHLEVHKPIYMADTLLYSADSNLYKVENLGKNVNSIHAESGPRISPDGKTLYFFRITHPKNIGNTRDIWVSRFNQKDSTWGGAEHLPPPINNYGENSVHSISQDGKTLLLHNKYIKNGTCENGVSTSTLQADGTWSFPEPLHIRHYKNDEVCSFHLSPNGEILILAIHYKDAYGHQDLYVSFKEKDGKHWTKPKNLGPRLNTPATEATAFLASDGKTLYFSSNGRKNTVGGFDIYKTTRLDSSWTNWSEPENMGIPYNTVDDEFYFSVPSVGDYAYLSHHYKGEDSLEHSDIVRIKLKEEKKPDPVLVLSGRIFDFFTKKPIEGNIEFVDETSKNIGGGDVDTLKGYNVILPKGHEYTYKATAPKYVTEENKLDLKKLKEYTEEKKDIYLKPAMLVLTGKVYDAKTKKPISAQLEFKKLPDTDFGKFTADSANPYLVRLPSGDVYEYTVKADGYLPEVQKIDLTNFNMYDEQERSIYLQPLKKDLSFTINNIYFDYNKATLKSESFPELDNLVKILKEVTEIKVEISAHTDADGSDAYNLDLSNRRAQSVVNYMISKGINKNALVAKGYGESKPIATNATDEGKAKNRRVEFKILEIN